jgi:hypothetical protein
MTLGLVVLIILAICVEIGIDRRQTAQTPSPLAQLLDGSSPR